MMTGIEFRAFLNLMMCSDPWPAGTVDSKVLEELADKESRLRGYDSWYVAFHEFKKGDSVLDLTDQARVAEQSDGSPWDPDDRRDPGIPKG